MRRSESVRRQIDSKEITLLRSPLLHFLILGALLFALKGSQTRLLEPIVIEVFQSEIDAQITAYQRQVGREASATEADSIENQIIENALWLRQARALGLHQTDPVVRQRLILNMRFLEEKPNPAASDENDDSDETNADELIEQAVALKMDRSDVIVRRRLIDRVQAMIRAGVRSRTPDEPVLRAHFEATTEHWRQPILLDLTHVYFSRDKRGDSANEDAAALLGKLIEMSIEPEAGVEMADPFLSGHSLRGATPTRITARFGPAFSSALGAQPAGRWIGPIESAFGSHLVWIHNRIERRNPPFEEVRKQVLEDWYSQEIVRALRVQIERSRQVIEVRVVDDREAARDDRRGGDASG